MFIKKTAKEWENILPKICDNIFSKFDPEYVYVFGSKDYTQFVKETDYRRKNPEKIKIFESACKRYQALRWLSLKISELVDGILNNKIDEFNKKYPSNFIRQDRQECEKSKEKNETR